MNIYFGDASGDIEPETTFKVGDYNFYYRLAINAEGDLVISDTCDRYVPLDPTSIASLLSALKHIAPYMEEISAGEYAKDYLTQDVNLIF